MGLKEILAISTALAAVGCSAPKEKLCSCNAEITPARVTCTGGTESIVQADHEARIYCRNNHKEQITFYAPGNICRNPKASYIRIKPEEFMAVDARNVPPEYNLRLWEEGVNDGISQLVQEQWDSIIEKKGYKRMYCE